MRKVISAAAGLAVVAFAAAVTIPANAVIGGATAPEIGANVAVNASGVSCSGTLITPRWVLSAWHCFDQSMTGTIEWGDTTRANGKKATFSGVAHEDDLALIRLDHDQELPAGAVAFPALADADPQVGATVQFFGFGVDDSKVASPVLRTGSAPVITPSNGGRADAYEGPSWTIKQNGNGNIAPGDSGGGAYLDGVLVGVASTANADHGNFASIAAHRQWIDRTISNNPQPIDPTPVDPTPSPSKSLSP